MQFIRWSGADPKKLAPADHTLKWKLRRNLLRPLFQPLTFLPGLQVADIGSDPATLALGFCQSRKLRHPLKLIVSSALSAATHRSPDQ